MRPRDHRSSICVPQMVFMQRTALACGAQTRVGVSPSDESSLRLEFDAEGRHFTATPDGYFENSPHCRITATVASGYSVNVDVSIKTY